MAYTIMVGEIFEKINSAKSKKGKKDILNKYRDVTALKHYLRGLFDPKIEWDIKEEPDYKPDVETPEGEEANSLYVEMPLCSIFVKGHKAGSALKPERRKQLLIQMGIYLCFAVPGSPPLQTKPVGTRPLLRPPLAPIGTRTSTLARMH